MSFLAVGHRQDFGRRLQPAVEKFSFGEGSGGAFEVVTPQILQTREFKGLKSGAKLKWQKLIVKLLKVANLKIR